jgi:2-polyprenyl-6-methoxyphenol hydroxylase-like FAD-dependent oxidoreductase
MEKEKKRREKVIVVGAGPVGSLAALYAANRGNEVEIYELRGGKLENTRPPFSYFLDHADGHHAFDCFASTVSPVLSRVAVLARVLYLPNWVLKSQSFYAVTCRDTDHINLRAY